MPASCLLLLALAAAADGPTAAEARAFVARVNADLERLEHRAATAEWVKLTHITDDTERLSAWADEELMAYRSRAVQEAARFRGLDLDPATARAVELLRTSPTLPAPADPARRAELATLASRLPAAYGKARGCGRDGKGPCRTLEALEEVMARTRSWDELLDAWAGWHAVGAPLREDYRRLVALGNEGARDIGFRDVGEIWRSRYDMPAEAFERELERLWAQVRPLYRELHCHVRARLQAAHGAGRVPDGRPIPAHLLGNMWAQHWGEIYRLVEPFPGVPAPDVDAALRAKGWDAVRMVKAAEAFFVSLGLAPLPASFWERSMLVRPRDREVVCHASAEDLDARDDLRIKMCIRPTGEDLGVIHHELGHNYYQRAYKGQPALFRESANGGFHEALGDTVGLSVTPGYLESIGLLDQAGRDPRSAVNVQMQVALDKVAFLPFGLLVDRWRWDVFSGKAPPERWNAAWWELRRSVQGVESPLPRTEADFDPGAKYHVPANATYAIYFLAHLYQFQFHQALCRAAGHRGPLHECSVAGSREAGRRLEAMMALGSSRPWPEAMQALTGQRQADASALLEYFAPLRRWLEEQNRGRRCGW
jgi:peptidyl-dipeptidase A